MEINHPSIAPDYYAQAGNLRSGDSSFKVLLSGEEDAPDNYRYGLVDQEEGQGEWSTPRHHHNFEQIRHPLQGDYSIGIDKTLPAGWVGYFPEAAYYGPQTLAANLKLLVVQFGGPSGQGFASVRQRRAGYDALLARGGKFVDGMYTWTDPDGTRHNQDAFEAVWEQMNGRKITYPKARYDSIILMNPANFAYAKDPDAEGIADKWLGTFTERNIKIGFVHLDKGASWRFGTEPSSEIATVEHGELAYEDKTHGPLSSFGTYAKDPVITLRATQETEIFYIKLPTFAA